VLGFALHPSTCHFQGQGAAIDSASFSADGEIVAGASGGEILVWNADSGALLRSFSGPGDPVKSIAFSRDGSKLVTLTGRGAAQLWDRASGQNLAAFVGHTLRVRVIAFSADGARVLTGSGDRTARIWEVDGGRPVATLVGHRDDITTVAFSADGKEALTAGADGTAKLWAVPASELMLSKAGTAEVGAVSFSPDGKRFVSAGYDKKTRLWDPATGQRLFDLEGHDDIVVAAAFAGDGTLIAAGSYDQTVRVWNASTGKEITILRGHDNAVRAGAIDATRIISAGADATVRSWNRVSFAPIQPFRIPGGRHEGIALSNDGRLVAMPDDEAAMRIWNVENGTLASALIGDKETLRYAVFSPDDLRILLIRENDIIRHYRTAKIWDLAARSPLASMEEGVDDIAVASFSADGKLVVSGHGGGAIRVWEADTGKLLALLSSEGSAVSAVAFSPNSERVVVGRRDGTVQVWDARRDTRSPSQLAAFVAARVRFQLRDGRLLPIAEAASSTAEAAGRP
jgi:WD40 repeat protein